MSNMDETEVSMQNAQIAPDDDVILITETVAAPISQRRRSERISKIHEKRNDPIEAHSSSQIGQVRVNQNARNNSTVPQIPKEKRRKKRKNEASNWNVETITSVPTNSVRNKKRRNVGKGQNKENGPPVPKKRKSNDRSALVQVQHSNNSGRRNERFSVYLLICICEFQPLLRNSHGKHETLSRKQYLKCSTILRKLMVSI